MSNPDSINASQQQCSGQTRGLHLSWQILVPHSMRINGLGEGTCSPLFSSAESKYIVKSQHVYRKRQTTIHIARHVSAFWGSYPFSAKLLISRNNLTIYKRKRCSIPASEPSQLHSHSLPSTGLAVSLFSQWRGTAMWAACLILKGYKILKFKINICLLQAQIAIFGHLLQPRNVHYLNLFFSWIINQKILTGKKKRGEQ